MRSVVCFVSFGVLFFLCVSAFNLNRCVKEGSCRLRMRRVRGGYWESAREPFIRLWRHIPEFQKSLLHLGQRRQQRVRPVPAGAGASRQGHDADARARVARRKRLPTLLEDTPGQAVVIDSFEQRT